MNKHNVSYLLIFTMVVRYYLSSYAQNLLHDDDFCMSDLGQFLLGNSYFDSYFEPNIAIFRQHLVHIPNDQIEVISQFNTILDNWDIFLNIILNEGYVTIIRESDNIRDDGDNIITNSQSLLRQ